MIAKNYWLVKVKQCFWILVLSVVLVQMLRYFSYYSKLPISFGEKFFYCLVVDRVIAVILFALKLPICYNIHTTNSFKDGSLSGVSNEVLVYVWLSTEISMWSVFFLVDTIFIIQLVLVIGTVVLQMWFWFYMTLILLRLNDKERHVRRVLNGMNPPLTKVEKIYLSICGYKTSDKMIGFGCYGTTYECTSSMTGAKLALKVIDIEEWTKSREPGAHPIEIQRSMQSIRHKYLRIAPRLRGLSHRNVVPFVGIHNEHNEGNAFTRIYLITEMAEMNLDKYLTEHQPNGLPEKCARDWFGQLCNGVYYLHNFVSAHSNIKPENILLYRKYLYYDNEGVLRFVSDHNLSLPDKYEKRYQYVLKLSDCGLDSFMPLKGKVVTKRKPLIMISAPKKVVGKGNLRILDSSPPKQKKCDDIYQMGVILVLLLRGDITRLIKAPADTQHIHNHVTGVDAVYVQFDKLKIIKKVLKCVDPSPKLIQLLRKMMEWEPLLRYDIHQVLDSDWMKQRDNN